MTVSRPVSGIKNWQVGASPRPLAPVISRDSGAPSSRSGPRAGPADERVRSASPGRRRAFKTAAQSCCGVNARSRARIARVILHPINVRLAASTPKTANWMGSPRSGLPQPGFGSALMQSVTFSFFGRNGFSVVVVGSDGGTDAAPTGSTAMIRTSPTAPAASFTASTYWAREKEHDRVLNDGRRYLST